MFTSPAPAAPTVSATTVSSTSTSPRSSGLRGGLTFLRNYTHGLHSQPSHAPGTAAGPREQARPPPAQSKSSGRPRAATTTPLISPSSPPSSSLPAASPIEHEHHAAAAAAAGGSASPTSAEARPVSRAAPRPPPPPPSQSLPSQATMTRNRAETAAPQLTVRNQSGPIPASTMATPQSAQTDATTKHLPSIRFIPHQDPRAARPSLQFSTISRTLPDESAVIRVGRYSERDNIPEVPPNVPSAAPVGFKSKVVSRKHCELWCKDGVWYIKDVKSSSGTFLNHIRLSQPNVESKPFRLKDGDIVQLGIDFRGGEEMIFRCVKIRIECNRGWQQALNTFNKQTHQRLRNLGKARKDGDNSSMHTSECSICLMSIAPCQSLFVAPCSHVWHYKCIRPILNGNTWPNFLCPNCRAMADLEADVEEAGDFGLWDDEGADASSESNANGDNAQEDGNVTPKNTTPPQDALSGNTAQVNGQISFADLEAAISNMNISDSLNGIANRPVPGLETPSRDLAAAPSSAATQPVSINVAEANEASGLSPMFPMASRSADSLSPERAPDCPMTPRNDAGPFVLDGSGSAGRATAQRFLDTESAGSGNSSAPILPPLHVD